MLSTCNLSLYLKLQNLLYKFIAITAAMVSAMIIGVRLVKFSIAAVFFLVKIAAAHPGVASLYACISLFVGGSIRIVSYLRRFLSISALLLLVLVSLYWLVSGLFLQRQNNNLNNLLLLALAWLLWCLEFERLIYTYSFLLLACASLSLLSILLPSILFLLLVTESFSRH